jgi:hypothetical protein
MHENQRLAGLPSRKPIGEWELSIGKPLLFFDRTGDPKPIGTLVFSRPKIEPDSAWGVGMKKTVLFKKYIFDPEIPVMPGAHGADHAGISSSPIKRRPVRMVSKRKKQLIEKAREKAINNPYHG